MTTDFDKPHIGRIEEYASDQEYKYPLTPNIKTPIAPRERAQHGNRILRKLQEVRQQLQLAEDTELPENIIRDDAIYVTFISEWGYPLKFDQLHQNTDRPTYQIVNIKREKHPEHENQYRYRVSLMLTKGGISHFIKKAEQYLTENTKDREGNITDTPKSNPLIANISNIKLATLEAFWSDWSQIPFPNENEIVWWEVWFRKTDNDVDRINKVVTNLEQSDAQIGYAQNELPRSRADEVSKQS